MSRTLLTLLAGLALSAGLALAQNQPAQNQAAQNQPGQPQQPNQPGQSQPMPPASEPPQAQPQHPAGQGQTGMSSQQLQAAFQRTFQKYPELSNVKVNVADDKIELSGTVPNQADKDKVRRTAETNADGRKVVDDDLKVGGGEDKPSSRPDNPPASDKPPMSEKPPIPPR